MNLISDFIIQFPSAIGQAVGSPSMRVFLAAAILWSAILVETYEISMFRQRERQSAFDL